MNWVLLCAGCIKIIAYDYTNYWSLCLHAKFTWQCAVVCPVTFFCIGSGLIRSYRGNYIFGLLGRLLRRAYIEYWYLNNTYFVFPRKSRSPVLRGTCIKTKENYYAHHCILASLTAFFLLFELLQMKYLCDYAHLRCWNGLEENYKIRRWNDIQKKSENFWDIEESIF